jgi:uncharacterized protein YxeA
MKKIVIGLITVLFIIVMYVIVNTINWINPPDTLFQNGTYSYLVKNDTGEIVYQADLIINNLSNPKFDFNISVGTSGGAGEIKGMAESLSPVSAYAKINEFEKICKLNFEVIPSTTPISIKVTEDNCLEYHGAGVQFEHQYIKTK